VTNYDAILIPGGGVREGGLLPSWVKRRLDLAVELFDGSYIVTLSAGTTHRPPPLDEYGFPIFESVAAAKHLVNLGVPRDRILVETQSYDTIGNAYFSRVIHIDPQRFRRLLVITSDFHLARTQFVFNWVYGLAPKSCLYNLDYRSVSDPGMEEAVLQNRMQKERSSLQSLKTLTDQLATMQDFHQWLFTEHNAYSASASGFGERKVGGLTLRSY
jgi:DUF218 domain